MEDKQNVKVHIDKIESYQLDKIITFIRDVAGKEQLWRRLEEASIKKILLKPNLLGPHKPEKAVTTHPAVMEAIIIVFQEKGFELFLGDSPGGDVSIDNLWQETGMKELAEKHDVKLLKFGEKGVEKVEKDGFKMILDKQVMSFDAIINVSKFKTHSLTLFTGAVKNTFGIVPGLTKSDYHREYPQPSKIAELLVKIYAEVKDRIVLNIMDGIIGMEGEGPSSGNPKNFGLMFASSSASALDYTAANMLGYHAELIPMVKMSLENDGLKPEDIETDSKWKGFVFEGTKIGKPSISSAFLNKLPPQFQKLFFRIFDYYPDFNKNCVLCLVCMKGCPVKAISFADKKLLKKGEKQRLTIDRSTCIKCMCCQEFCKYKGISLKKTLLAKLILR